MAGFNKLEVATIIAAVAAWAKQQPEICGVALVGSWARNRTHENSDLDLMLLATNPELFFRDTNWFNKLDWQKLNLQTSKYYDRIYGVVRSRHLCFTGGQRIEFTFGYRSWANINPIDPGTSIVVSSGIKILYDPDNLFNALVSASKHK